MIGAIRIARLGEAGPNDRGGHPITGGLVVAESSTSQLTTESHHTAEALAQSCVKAGLKMTGQRRVILQVLAESSDHPSVDTVFQRARDIDSSISIATVYRTLHVLDELNLVQRHDFNESHSRFEVNVDHHHHLVDVESGEVVEFQDEKLEAMKQRIADELGYDLVDHRLELYGRKKS